MIDSTQHNFDSHTRMKWRKSIYRRNEKKMNSLFSLSIQLPLLLLIAASKLIIRILRVHGAPICRSHSIHLTSEWKCCSWSSLSMLECGPRLISHRPTGEGKIRWFFFFFVREKTYSICICNHLNFEQRINWLKKIATIVWVSKCMVFEWDFAKIIM